MQYYGRVSWAEQERMLNAWRARKEARQAEAIRQAAEAARLKAEEKEAARLEKEERQKEKARFTYEQADADIAFLSDRLAQLDAQVDYLTLQQATLLPGSKGFEQIQRKLVTLYNQVHTAERQLNKAQFTRAQAAKAAG